MAHHEITFPTDEATVRELHAGDTVTIQGHIVGIRDATQIRIFDKGVEPPFSLTGAALLAHRAQRPQARRRRLRADVHRHDHQRPDEPLHRGPDPRPRRRAPSSARADCCPSALEPLREHGGVYLAIVGGAAALETTQIEEIERVEWEDLMPECLWLFRVRDFGPLIVGMDTHGESLYENVQVEARKRLEESIYERL